MRALVYDRYGYGPLDLARVGDVPVPAPAAGEVRIRVAATSVDLRDRGCLRGSPLYAGMEGLTGGASVRPSAAGGGPR